MELRRPTSTTASCPTTTTTDRVERTTISDAELQDYLTKIGGKKIFFFDTCYSGAILSGRAHEHAAGRGQVRQ